MENRSPGEASRKRDQTTKAIKNPAIQKGVTDTFLPDGSKTVPCRKKGGFEEGAMVSALGYIREGGWDRLIGISYALDACSCRPEGVD